MGEEVEGLEFPEYTARAVVLDGVELTDTRITIHDVMSAGHCVRGAKRWFEQKGLDFPAFLKNGISAYDFLNTRDGQAVGVARHMIGRK